MSELTQAQEAATGVASLVRGILTPLSKASADLLKPIRLTAYDRLRVSLNAEGTHFVCKPYGFTQFNREVQASWEARYQWAERVPEREDRGGYMWLMRATDFTALVINACWPEDRLEMDDEARTVYTFLLARFMQQTVSSQTKAMFKLRHSVPAMPDDFVDHPEKPLSDYQRVALVTSLDQDQALFMKQGTGKTPIVIRRICVEAHRHIVAERELAASQGRKPRLYTVVVACPKNVRANWERELGEFCTVAGNVVVLRGGKLKRTKAIIEALTPDEDAEFAAIITSYEGLSRTWEILSALPVDLAVVDESHYIQNSYTKRQKTFLEFRECCEHRMVLTGTPMSNRLQDLWGQLEFLGEGLSGFSSPKAFANFYANYEGDGELLQCPVELVEQEYDSDSLAGLKWHRRREWIRTTLGVRDEEGIRLAGHRLLDPTDANRYSNLPLLQERLSRLAFMITKEEAGLGLQPKVHDIYEVEMTPHQRDCYVRLQEQLALQIKSESETKTMTPQNILVRLLRLAQITSGFATWDEQVDDMGITVAPRRFEFFEPVPKAQAILDILAEQGPLDKTIVWACFIPDIKKISETLTLRGIKHVVFYGGTSDNDRAEAERAFNEDADCRVFIGNPAAGGTGLNLRGYNPDWVGTPRDHGCACSRVIYYSEDWSMIKREQSEDRAHRRGTRTQVRYTTLCVADSIDTVIYNRLMSKTKAADTLQNVREVMERVLSCVPEIGE